MKLSPIALEMLQASTAANGLILLPPSEGPGRRVMMAGSKSWEGPEAERALLELWEAGLVTQLKKSVCRLTPDAYQLVSDIAKAAEMEQSHNPPTSDVVPDSVGAPDRLMERLKDPEDNFVERKVQGVRPRDIRRTVVAFANSLPEARSGVLFVGIRNDGTIEGVDDTDALQKRVRQACDDCYPPIRYRCEVMRMDGKAIVAVVVEPSGDGPHFSGPACVRVGSETVVASERVLTDLIVGRTDPGRRLLAFRGKIVTVSAVGKKLGDTKPLGGTTYHARYECRIEDVSPFEVRLLDITTGRNLSEPMRNVTVAWDTERDRLKLIVENR